MSEIRGGWIDAGPYDHVPSCTCCAVLKDLRPAFDALLAVAKAAAAPETTRDAGEEWGCCRLCGRVTPDHWADECPISALDAAHPGWREWTP